MVHFNHLIGFITSPLTGVSLLFVLGGLLRLFRKRRIGNICIVLGIVFIYLFSSGVMLRVLSASLFTGEYRNCSIESLPGSSAIVVLGGGVGKPAGFNKHPELFVASDRVWHAARLWRAGKAPKIVVSGSSERVASLPFLLELGIPADSILVDDKSGNTEENAKLVQELLADTMHDKADGKLKVLLVTSSWHMKRAAFMFKRYAPDLEVVPAPTDFEAVECLNRKVTIWDFIPSAETLYRNTYLFKEVVGYWGYKLFR